MTTNVRESAPSRIFLSYAHEDSAIARLVADVLRDEYAIRTDLANLEPGQPWATGVLNEAKSADMVVLLLSKATLRDGGARREAELLTSEARRREIDLVPVLLQRIQVPASLQAMLVVDLSDGGTEEIRRLATRLRNQRAIDFARLSPQGFEQMVGQILEYEGFNFGDAQASQDQRYDLLGIRGSQAWIVEVKHYSESRISIRTIHEMIAQLDHVTDVAQLDRMAVVDIHGLLVTNAQLTLVAASYLDEAGVGDRIQVLDGVDLEHLLLKHPALLERYFSSGGSGEA